MKYVKNHRQCGKFPQKMLVKVIMIQTDIHF